jgi:PAS domain S-box-containing protein
MPVEHFVKQFVHPEDAPIIFQAIQKSIEDPVNNAKGTIEYRTTGKDGQMRYILTEYRLDLDNQGNPMATHGSHLDITQRKKAEEALAKRAAELKRGK